MKISVEEIDAEEFVKYLESENVFVRAHGEVDKTLKMYLYSYEISNDAYFLAEFIIDFKNMELNYTIKAMNNSLIKPYENYFLKIIDPIL